MYYEQENYIKSYGRRNYLSAIRECNEIYNSDYSYEVVKHSIEFINENETDTNSMEGL